MSKITNDGLTRSGTECFTAVPIWQQWASKGYKTTNLLCVIDGGKMSLKDAFPVDKFFTMKDLWERNIYKYTEQSQCRLC